MINFSLASVLTAIQLVRSHMAMAAAALSSDKINEPLEPAYRDVVQNNLQYVHKKSGDYLLTATEDRVVRIWNIWSERITHGQLAIELKPLLEALEDDLRKLHLYLYPQHKFIPLLQMPGVWAPAFAAFPSAKDEAEEGIDCYGLEHNTACVFHMMRVVEHGLRALARERGVSFPNRPVEWATWQQMLDQIESSGRKAARALPAGPQRDAALGFYSGAAGQIHAFKDKYRNMVMHVRRRYGEVEALQSINQVRDFMNGLSVKIGEKIRKPIRRWP
jgi:hypothetical protein